MSGNVKEWVLSTTTTTGPFEMRGGAYDTASFTSAHDHAPGLQCDASIPRPATAAVRSSRRSGSVAAAGELPP